MTRVPCPRCGVPVPKDFDFDTIRNMKVPAWIDDHHYAVAEHGESVGIRCTAPCTHELKVKPEFFHALSAGIKMFEIRFNDRGYAVGDRLHLREFDGENYSGFSVTVEVMYLTDFEQKPGFVVMGLKP